MAKSKKTKTKRKKPRWQWWTKKRLRETAVEEVTTMLTRQERRKISKKDFAEKVREVVRVLAANWKVGTDNGRRSWSVEHQMFLRNIAPVKRWNQL